MEEVRDINGRLICYADSILGILESAYKKQVIKIYLPVGGEVIIHRENVSTQVKRPSETQFYVYSQHD